MGIQRSFDEEQNRYGISRRIAARSQVRATGIYGDHAYRDTYWRKLSPEALHDQARCEAVRLGRRGGEIGNAAISDLLAWASQRSMPRAGRRHLKRMPHIDMAMPDDCDDPRWEAFERLEAFAAIVEGKASTSRGSAWVLALMVAGAGDAACSSAPGPTPPDVAQKLIRAAQSEFEMDPARVWIDVCRPHNGALECATFHRAAVGMSRGRS